MRKLHYLLILSLLIVGCEMSKEEISKTVKYSMQDKFKTDPMFRDYKLEVESIAVIKQSSNNYQGLAKVVYQTELYEVPIDITVDGKNVMWQSKPAAFAFILQKQLEQMQY